MSKKVMIEVEEDAMKVLDDYIKSCYSNQLWWKYHGGFTDVWDDTVHQSELVLKDVVEAKKLAKAFGLYPYNQPIVNNP